MFEIISSRSLDRFVRRRFRRSEADLTEEWGARHREKSKDRD